MIWGDLGVFWECLGKTSKKLLLIFLFYFLFLKGPYAPARRFRAAVCAELETEDVSVSMLLGPAGAIDLRVGSSCWLLDGPEAHSSFLNALNPCPQSITPSVIKVSLWKNQRVSSFLGFYFHSRNPEYFTFPL